LLNSPGQNHQRQFYLKDYFNVCIYAKVKVDVSLSLLFIEVIDKMSTNNQTKGQTDITT